MYFKFLIDELQVFFFFQNGDQEEELQEFLELESKLAASAVHNPIQMLEIKSQRWKKIQNEIQLAKKELSIVEKLM